VGILPGAATDAEVVEEISADDWAIPIVLRSSADAVADRSAA
jgi:hypothetical protein